MMKKNMSDEELKEKEMIVRERLSGVDFNKVVCPITFIGDHITNANTVNEMYVIPYYSHNAIKHVQEECTPNIVTEIAPTLDVTNAASLKDAIDAYFHMNLYSLTYDTLIKFIQEAFIFEIDNRLLPDGVNKPAALYIVEKYTNLINMDLQNELNNFSSYWTILPQRWGFTDLNDFNSVHELLSAQMSRVFSHIVDGVFNKAINKIVDHSLKDGSFETIFDIVYYTCYEESPKAEAKSNVQVMTQFVAGYLRDVMEEQLEMYRNGLDLMAITITGMITGKAD